MRCLLAILLAILAVANARDLTQAGKCLGDGKLFCAGVCTNTNGNTKHCGACFNACRPGEDCGASPKRCKCGSKNVSCRADQRCDTTLKACVCDFDQGLAPCGAECKALATDPSNCGTCGTSCLGDPTLSGQCVAGQCTCADGLSQCPAGCLDLQNDEQNCGACGNACPAGQACDGGVCKCTSSAQCPDEAPICDTATGTCGICTYANDKGVPCATRAAALGITAFQCDYPSLGGSGRCVECNIASRALDNDCLFLISHPYPEAATIPTIDPSFTYCGADNKCTVPPS